MTLFIPKTFFGIDRNASNITYGNSSRAVQFTLKKLEEIERTTRGIVWSFRRNDVRIRKMISAKYGKRRSERVKRILHHVSRAIVEDAKRNEGAIVFENIEGLRKSVQERKLSRSRIQSKSELDSVGRNQEAGRVQSCLGTRSNITII